MAINIYKEEGNETIKFLSEDNWELPFQLYELENWLEKEGKDLPKGNYVADIGFEVRKDASGGGGVLSLKMIEIMNNIGMEIYFSEYKNE